MSLINELKEAKLYTWGYCYVLYIYNMLYSPSALLNSNCTDNVYKEWRDYDEPVIPLSKIYLDKHNYMKGCCK